MSLNPAASGSQRQLYLPPSAAPASNPNAQANHHNRFNKLPPSGALGVSRIPRPLPDFFTDLRQSINNKSVQKYLMNSVANYYDAIAVESNQQQPHRPGNATSRSNKETTASILSETPQKQLKSIISVLKYFVFIFIKSYLVASNLIKLCCLFNQNLERKSMDKKSGHLLYSQQQVQQQQQHQRRLLINSQLNSFHHSNYNLSSSSSGGGGGVVVTKAFVIEPPHQHSNHHPNGHQLHETQSTYSLVSSSNTSQQCCSSSSEIEDDLRPPKFNFRALLRKTGQNLSDGSTLSKQAQLNETKQVDFRNVLKHKRTSVIY